jgi:hypothetical protein
MAWLATEQDRIYGDLSKSMDLSDKRAKFADDLNNIKAELQQANDSNNFTKVDASLQDFMKAYGSDPELGDLCKGLQEMADKIHSDLPATQPALNPALQAVTQPPPNGFSYYEDLVKPKPPATIGAPVAAPNQPARSEQHYSDDQLKTWDTLIGDKTDVSGKNDQLTMIHIQELKATLDQGAQLGSTFISSGDKTSSAIINNIA